MSESWEGAFAAVSAALGERTDDVTAALGDGGSTRGAEVLRGLRAPTRDARARAIARVLSQVAVDLEKMRLA